MVKSPMPTQQRSHPALDLLNQAESEFVRGELLQASAKFWGAAALAVVAVAAERGWRCENDRDLKDVVMRLADEHDNALLHSEFIAAENLHMNMYHNLLQNFQVDTNSLIVHHFVHHALTLLQNPQPAQPVAIAIPKTIIRRRDETRNDNSTTISSRPALS